VSKRKFSDDLLNFDEGKAPLRRKLFKRPGSAHTADLQNEREYLAQIKDRLNDNDPLLNKEK